MFLEMTQEEQLDINGGALPAIPVIIKVGALILGGIFTAGAVKGCTDEAAKDME